MTSDPQSLVRKAIDNGWAGVHTKAIKPSRAIPEIERRRAIRAANIAAGLTCLGQPRKRSWQRRDGLTEEQKKQRMYAQNKAWKAKRCS